MPARPGRAVGWWLSLAALAALSAAAPLQLQQQLQQQQQQQQQHQQQQQARCERHRKQLHELADSFRSAPVALDTRVRAISQDSAYATFKVQKVLKGSAGREPIRLQLPKDTQLKMDGRYMLLVTRKQNRAFSLLHPPTPRRIAKCLRIAPARHKTTPTYGLRRKTTHVPLVSRKTSERNLRIGEKLKLNCLLRSRNSNPQWHKDGQPLHRENQRIKLHPKKRQLNLVINRVQPEDSGVYECYTNPKHVLSKVNVYVMPNTTLTTKDTNVMSEEPCPMAKPNTYCQNGGECQFITDLNEPYCKCPDGYEGQRCENKNVQSRNNSMYLYHSYTCKHGLFSSFYC